MPLSVESVTELRSSLFPRVHRRWLLLFLAPDLCLPFKIALSGLPCGRSRLFPRFLIMALGSGITLTVFKATV